jgi:phage FluMu protein Com
MSVDIINKLKDGEVVFEKETSFYYFKCPHCKDVCMVHKKDIRCTIFRHAVYKKDMQFVPPHALKEECERWLKEDLVYGCTKPFKFDGNEIKICNYI